MEIKLSEPIGILAEGDITSLKVVCNDMRFQIGEILIIKPPQERRYYLFRVMNYENILRHTQDLASIAANFLRNRQAYIARVEAEKLVKVHGLLMGYSEYDYERDEYVFYKPRSLPQHFSEVYRGSASPEALKLLLRRELGKDISIGKLLIGTKTLDIPVNIDVVSLPMHVQVAGTTGAGKSFFMLTFITSALRNNLLYYTQIKKEQENKRVAVFMVDVHDEYMLGLRSEGKRLGIKDIANASLKAGNQYYSALFGEKFYLTKDLASVSKDIEKFTKALRFRREDLTVNDVVAVMSNLSDQMISYMNTVASSARKEEKDWITLIEEADEETQERAAKVTVSAVKRRLFSIFNSELFGKDDYSDLAEIIYNLECGRFYNFSTALLNSTEQFLVLTMIARTLFALRQSLLSSTRWSQFCKQVKNRLPKKIAQELLGEGGNSKYSLLDVYTAEKNGNDYRLIKVDQLPVVMLTVEEAPSILGHQMSKEGNIFIDISRQGRKFRIGMLLITQNITSMEPIILANTNTEINMMLGNDMEIKQAILNASNNISGYEHEFKVLSRGEAILTNSLKNVPIPVKVYNVPYYIESLLPFFSNPYEYEKVKKPKEKTEIPFI